MRDNLCSGAGDQGTGVCGVIEQLQKKEAGGVCIETLNDGPPLCENTCIFILLC